jgi:ubiquinone/menaquinone biosynthesis C-methylase UbiE
MANSGFDHIQYKLGQRESWDSVAAGWQKWWKTVEKGAQKVSDKLIELAEIKPAHRVLDIATGIGEPAVSAARRVGDKGRVIATDISPQMLAIGKERAESQGLQDIIEFREGDAELLDLPNSSFNAALCRWGLMFMPNISKALDNIKRSLVSGGRLAASVWAEPTRVPFINLPMKIVREHLQIASPQPGIPGPFSLANVNEFSSSLLRAGFSDINSEEIRVTFEFDSAEDYARFTQEIAAPVNLMLANETEKRRIEIWKTVIDEVKLHHLDSGTGHVRFDNESICVAGRLQ